MTLIETKTPAYARNFSPVSSKVILVNGEIHEVFDNSGNLNVVLSGIVDENNSTSDTLGIGGIFQGSSTDILDYGYIFVTIYSDQNSATDGLSVQQSSDGINWDNIDVYNILATKGKTYSFQPAAKYFRVVYTNGGTAQGVFRLQTVLKKTASLPSSHRLKDYVTDNDDAQLFKGILAYRDENDDTYNNVGIQNPMPTDGDFIYTKDIWNIESDIGNFSGDVNDLFNNIHSVIVDSTTNNPKELFIHFNRTIITNTIGIGSYSGNFSNTKIEIYNSGGIPTTVIDEGSNNTKYTTRTFQLPITAGFNAIKFIFSTTDTITLSNCVIPKARGVVARLQAKKPDDTITDINATNGGNLKISLEELESDISVNSNSQMRITQFDSSGNEIVTQQDADGNYHLGTSMIQSIITSTNNSTTSNLASGATFTGPADETYGINGIQVFHYADQDCTIYIDQSISDSDWSGAITDSFECLANTPCSRTFVSVSPYYRMRVTNNGSNATTSISSFTGMTPFINPLPRSLSSDGRLISESTLVGQQNTDRHVWVTPTNALNTVSTTRLIGTNFDGTTKDTNFWTESVTGTGSVTQLGGEIEIATGTTANSTAQYNSVRRARFVVSSPLNWQSIVKFVTAGTIDNIRRIGAYDNNNGFFYELDGSTFSIGYRKATVDTLVNSGSFNGNYGPNYIIDTAYHKFTIEWGPKGIFFYIDGVLLHKDGQGHRSDYLSLPIRFENNNDNGLTTNVVLDVLASAIVRYGELVTNGTYKYLGTNATTVLKYGPGVLQRIVNTDNAGNITVYDNTAASGTQIAVIDTTKALGALEFNAPFSNGLTVVVASGAKITVVYE